MSGSRHAVVEVDDTEGGGADDIAEGEADPKPAAEGRNFGTFGGVFTPTVLTILGVIMYLRVGWVVGNAGFLGAVAIITLAFLIAGFTALSMSSITTNIRIGAGGAYAILVQSLGLEVGGSLGIPRYLSQALAITMYIFGFREGWLWFFPGHDALLVDGVALVGLFIIAYLSANLAIRVQYVIMAIIVGSLVSVGLAAATGSMEYPVDHVTLWGTYPGSPEDGFAGADFWMVFAVFFPASTGIMAGANMSGDLARPRESIPRGTMAAVVVSYLIYIALAYWIARSATVDELVSNYYVMVDEAFWGPIVVAGLIGACFSSALASLVGSGRILQAMGDHGIVPAADWLAVRTKQGEPRNAMIITGLIVAATLLLRDLNAVAPLITLFFLITYLMLNVVLLIEQSLGLASFRPLFRVHWVVPLLGAAGSLTAMFVVSPLFTVIAVGITLAVYWMLVRAHIETKFEDLRSGLFVSLADWATRRVRDLPTGQERAWRPKLLLPIENAPELRGEFQFITDIVQPKGSVKILGLSDGPPSPGMEAGLRDLHHAFRDNRISSSWTIIDTGRFADSLIAAMQALRGSTFAPNLVFLHLTPTESRQADFTKIIDEAGAESLGVLLFAEHMQAGLGRRQRINVWVRGRAPDWKLSMDIGNIDLQVLIAYKLMRNWGAKLRFITVVDDADEVEPAHAFLDRLRSSARLPDADILVQQGTFRDLAGDAPVADLNVLGLPRDPDFDFVREMVRRTQASCLFMRASGEESALA